MAQRIVDLSAVVALRGDVYRVGWINLLCAAPLLLAAAEMISGGRLSAVLPGIAAALLLWLHAALKRGSPAARLASACCPAVLGLGMLLIVLSLLIPDRPALASDAEDVWALLASIAASPASSTHRSARPANTWARATGARASVTTCEGPA